MNSVLDNPFSFPHSRRPFSNTLYKEPSSEYRGCPLWSWNDKLNFEQIRAQIGDFVEMGMGGFHIHSRIGLDTEYLGVEFMSLVKRTICEAEKEGLFACLYDEDRWPSGCTGGKVVDGHPEFRLQHLLFTNRPYGQPSEPPMPSASGRAIRSEEGFLLTRYHIRLNEDGGLHPDSRQLHVDEPASLSTWYAYVEPNPASEWFNGQTYVDTLNPKAIARFIETTHEVYRAEVGEEFGSSVPSIFTDEPQFAHKTQLRDPFSKEDVFMPWTSELPKSYHERYGTDLLQTLPEVIWDLPEQSRSQTRYRFHDFLCESFVQAFMDQISTWCRSNGIFLTGHMMKEPFLWSQTDAVGDAMRCYRNLDVPGVDILCDRLELNTVKQAVSVARQNGSHGVMSEIYGVTNWSYTFEGYKGQGDWQAALGITLRVPHLTWISMRGEAKRDYPASIGRQSTWYQEFSNIEDHFARVNVAMTRGKAVTRIAVIHPIESYWLTRGPISTNSDEQAFLERCFSGLTRWLLFGLLDFDFVSESLLPQQNVGINDGDIPSIRVGQCKYEVVIVPNLITVRTTTVEALKEFAARGGKVILTGKVPTHQDVNFLGTTFRLENSLRLAFSQRAILDGLKEHRDISITESNGTPTERFLYQMRDDGENRYVFIANTERTSGYFTNPKTIVALRGSWKVYVMDTTKGTLKEIFASISGDQPWTSFPHRFDGCSDLLLRLIPGSPSPDLIPLVPVAERYQMDEEVTLHQTHLSEPNVLLLDYAEYRLGSEQAWRKSEEILRIDNIIRTELHLPLKLEAYRQPWAISQERRRPVDFLSLRFTFMSDHNVDTDLQLALEDPESLSIWVNEIEIPNSATGSWVDSAIRTVPLPKGVIIKGSNTVQIEIPFGLLTNLERIYLLGKFGVALSGSHSTLVRQPDLIHFGDATRQGFPFYAGNIKYICSFYVADQLKSTAISIPRFCSAVLRLNLTNVDIPEKIWETGLIFAEPYIFEFGMLPVGHYQIEIVAYGNRFNAFGHVHLPEGKSKWCGPLLWRTDDDWWTKEYELVKIGVIGTPRILRSGTPRKPIWKEGPTYW